MTTERSILIVDDECGLAETLREMLCEYGHDVMLAINGRLALDILNENPVDLVITDLMMPVMNGAELAAVMRQNDRLCAIPVIMMSSLPPAPLARPHLFDAVLRKPFTPALLLDTMAACCRWQGDAAEESSGGPDPSGGASEGASG